MKGVSTDVDKMALSGFPPLAVAGIRFFLGGFTVWILARIIGVSFKMQTG